ncbi:MAG: hypothetical protein PHG58_12060 [Clostridia bacterium]|nr:hypothetical protein [Clostridia bacterium]
MAMVNESGFIVRKSGIRQGDYYIDYAGTYTVGDIAKLTGVKAAKIMEIYSENGAIFDDVQNVYFFRSTESAKNAVGELFANVKPEKKAKAVYLSEAEVEYIRRALINEGSNTLYLKGTIKDEIFKKLNG